MIKSLPDGWLASVAVPLMTYWLEPEPPWMEAVPFTVTVALAPVVMLSCPWLLTTDDAPTTTVLVEPATVQIWSDTPDELTLMPPAPPLISAWPPVSLTVSRLAPPTATWTGAAHDTLVELEEIDAAVSWFCATHRATPATDSGSVSLPTMVVPSLE